MISTWSIVAPFDQKIPYKKTPPQVSIGNIATNRLFVK